MPAVMPVIVMVEVIGPGMIVVGPMVDVVVPVAITVEVVDVRVIDICPIAVVPIGVNVLADVGPIADAGVGMNGL